MEYRPSLVRNRLPSIDNGNGVVARSEDAIIPKLLKERGIKLRQRPDQDSRSLERIALDSRVLIIEGVSGSGKDRFQAYLKEKLDHRDVYDFAEGELLHSWKHIPIKGILNLTVKFMGLFIEYLKDIVSREKNAVFLLNRFHLSTYASITTRHPELLREYNESINVLRTLPVHVFILQLDEGEIERRSLHSERSGVWPKLQRQMVANDGFRNRSEKYISQQSLMIEAATTQHIPYSMIKFSGPPDIDGGRVPLVATGKVVRRGGRMNPTDSKISRKKREIPQTF